ncbi:NfeD family protein [Sneathia sp. DSM 16631]|uniref:NfeD family protein n=1 Tax=Sneathia TaxID=168808 RepID=UPI001867653C|nr:MULTISPECIES: NfeD family protein [Sneathia]MBE3030372.1 NfeD family protein [Sneathia sp. DSM 16631]MDK9581781.1 NfeD family protein [Sneathia vaginalis]
MCSLFWGLLAGALLIIELIIPALVSIWFAIAAFITMFLALMINSFTTQVVIFILISLVLLVFTKKIVTNFLKPDMDKINKEMLEDNGLVTKIISSNKYEVKFKGVIWTAISNDELNIGDVVKIVGYKGNKVIIKRKVNE